MSPLLFIALLSLIEPSRHSPESHPAVPTTWDSLVQIIKERDSFYLKRIRELDDSLRTPWIEQIAREGRSQEVINQQKFLKEQEAGLQKVLDHLDRLKKSRNVSYKVILLTDTTQISETVYDTASRSIVFKVLGPETFIHESTHGFQFENGSLAYEKHGRGARGCDVQDEIDAYRAEYYFDPAAITRLPSKEKITSPGSISKKWLATLVNRYGVKIYSCGGWAYTAQIPIDIHSSPRRLIKAYQCYPHDWRNWPITHAIAEDPDFVTVENFKTAP